MRAAVMLVAMKAMALRGVGSGARAETLERLTAMPALLREAFASLSIADARWSPRADEFAPVEHAWHLADLEREGYGERIRRLRDEPHPFLPDFDGARIARERDYRSLDLAAGLRAFEQARAANLELLRALTDEQWAREGTQEGVGTVALCDLPALIAQHDAAHRGEIEMWLRVWRARRA